jgi:MFS family permease
MMAYGIVAPVAGGLVDKIGPRRTMGIGATRWVLSLTLSAWGDKPWHFYLTFGVLAGAGLCLIGSVAFTTVLRNWFERRRGMALSLLFAGTGAGFAFYPLVALLISSVGWRNTFLVEAIVIAATVLPLVVLIVRYHPRDKGLIRDGVLETRQTSSAAMVEPSDSKIKAWVAIEWTLLKAARTQRFWLLCLATFCAWGISMHIMVTHHVAFAVDVGYSKIYASSVLSLYGLLFVCGSLSGMVSDRIGREASMTIATIAAISGITVLIQVVDTSQPWMLYYYAAALGLGQGMMAPTIAATATDIFQGPKVGTTIGFIWFTFAIGGAIGPWLGGWIFETTGSYLPAFVLAIALFAVGCTAIWLAGPRQIRGQICSDS